jgi:hypothetical protein
MWTGIRVLVPKGPKDSAWGFSAPWKGRVDPVGGRYPTRQLLLQPEAVGAWRAGNGTARSL